MTNDDPFLVQNEKKEFLQNIMDPASLSNVSANIVCFIVFQCLFFYFVASKQYDSLVIEKATFLQGFFQTSPLVGKIACAKMQTDLNKVVKEIELKKIERQKENVEQLKNTAINFVVPAGIISVILASIAIYKNKWKSSHTLALVLIAACFSTELVIYLAVFKTHIILGDYELLKMIFDKKYKE